MLKTQDDDAYVFLNKQGGVLTSQGYNQKMKEWNIDYLKYGIQNFSTK